MEDKGFNIADEFQKGWKSETSDVKSAPKISAHDFVFIYARTLDPHDRDCPIKKFPDKKYLRELVTQWLDNDLLLVVKSRQMMISWLMCALHLWDTMYHEGRICFIVSKKEDDANFSRELSMLSRVKFIYDRLPEELKVEHHIRQKPACFEFPNIHSSLYGVSQDSDALRQYTATTLFWDEMAFHEHAAQAYAAVKPTIDGGGKLCGVSTPNGKLNLFYDLVHDTKKKKIKNKTNLE